MLRKPNLVRPLQVFPKNRDTTDLITDMLNQVFDGHRKPEQLTKIFYLKISRIKCVIIDR